MGTQQTVDAVVIGAGFGGIYAMHRLANEQGLTVLGFDRAMGPGGTWYWNRYPGALSDSESYVYQYFFDKELYQDTTWENTYLTQPEILSYLEGVVDRFDLRRHFRFGVGIAASHYDEAANQWELTTDDGGLIRATYVINAVGLLAAVNLPDIPGRDSFEGKLVHTARWPEGLDVTGQRVAVIGTGSTGQQVVTALGPTVAKLGVFVRTPQYSVPVGLRPMDEGEVEQYHADFDKTRDKVFGSALGFGLDEVERSLWDYSEQQREQIFTDAWNEGGGFRFMFSTFGNLATDEEANMIAGEFVKDRIREIVKDPEIAAKIMPAGLHARRPLCDNGYYRTFNLPQVEAINVSDTPIEEITPTGIRTSDGIHREYDVIVFATGFDAVDGNYRRMDLTGRNGLRINEAWKDDPTSYLGMTTAGFPNWFMVLGPKGPFCNLPSAIEAEVEWISGAIAHARENGIATIEPTAEAEEKWSKICSDLATGSVFGRVDSWIFGANIPGKTPSVLFYLGGLAAMKELLVREAEAGYPNLMAAAGGTAQGRGRSELAELAPAS
ncbi:flavin-containing monooxygenase [Arthrobacter sp. USHLN218]|uniref:flavin-containing monooxygenase n=1 Tax=Arthrobacter sp. USHLN218 TaxID=3081232 RepID=UPI00301A6E9B